MVLDRLLGVGFAEIQIRIGNYAQEYIPEVATEVFIYFRDLCQCNMACYIANTSILEERSQERPNNDNIAKHEWQARKTGERRVMMKTLINKTLAKRFIKQIAVDPRRSDIDDIVYSVGEMLDRISIEWLKQQVLPEEKAAVSREWMSRVEKHLVNKLKTIQIERYYEAVPEMRTYEIDSIVDKEKTV